VYLLDSQTLTAEESDQCRRVLDVVIDDENRGWV
jgi:hypothetical protein